MKSDARGETTSKAASYLHTRQPPSPCCQAASWNESNSPSPTRLTRHPTTSATATDWGPWARDYDCSSLVSTICVVLFASSRCQWLQAGPSHRSVDKLACIRTPRYNPWRWVAKFDGGLQSGS